MFTTPPLLSLIDTVELCLLGNQRQHVGNPSFSVGHGFAILQTHWLGQDEVNQVISWWNQLEKSVVARCHIPSFGLNFYQHDQLVAQASICWRCNNIYFAQAEPQVLYCFDSSSPESEAILELFQNFLPVTLPGVQR